MRRMQLMADNRAPNSVDRVYTSGGVEGVWSTPSNGVAPHSLQTKVANPVLNRSMRQGLLPVERTDQSTTPSLYTI
jgi:hypothetical protein